jgi:hypothetical protein
MTTNQRPGEDRDTHGVPASAHGPMVPPEGPTAVPVGMADGPAGSVDDGGPVAPVGGSARFLPGMPADLDLTVLDGARVFLGGMDLTLVAQQAARAAHSLALPVLDQEPGRGVERPGLDRDDATGHPATDMKILDHARAADQATHTALNAGYAAVDLSETLAAITRLTSALEALSMATTIALDQAITIQDTAEKTLSRHQAEIEHLQIHPTGPHVLAESTTTGTIDTPANTPGYRSPAEISRAARISPATARRGLRTATRLRRDMPRMFTALADGTITIDAARTVARRAGTLTRTQRRTVDQMLHDQLPALTSKGTTSWNREMTGLIGHIDPDGAESRQQAAVRDRHVTITPAPDGMGHLSALLPALDAAAIGKKLSLAAERTMSTGGGKDRTHGQVMADTFTDLLLERGDGLDPIGLDVSVVVTDRTLFSPAHEDPATIEGLGTTTAGPVREKITTTLPPRRLHLSDPPVRRHKDADQPVREAAVSDGPVVEDPFEVDTARVLLRRVLADPDSGQLVAMESIARTFPTGLARMIRMRDDHTCQGPYCEAPIRHLDHIHPHTDGGTTSLDNGNGLCEYCNLVKELTGTTRPAEDKDEDHDPPLPGHTLVWESRTGRRDHVTPPPLIPGARPPLPAPSQDPAPGDDSAHAQDSARVQDAAPPEAPAPQDSPGPSDDPAAPEDSASDAEPDLFTPAPWDLVTFDDEDPEDLSQPTLEQLDAIHAAHRIEYEHAPWPEEWDHTDPDDYTHAA